jgi:hypothetical protein
VLYLGVAIPNDASFEACGSGSHGLWVVLLACFVCLYSFLFVLGRDSDLGSYPYSTGTQNTSESLTLNRLSRKKKANLRISSAFSHSHGKNSGDQGVAQGEILRKAQKFCPR